MRISKQQARNNLKCIEFGTLRITVREEEADGK
jgi:hypothetical protein